MKKFAFLLTTLIVSGFALADAPIWSEPVVVDYRDEPVVTYRARLAGDYLVIEAVHGEAWHTYAMDNVERARAVTGKETPETELPTRITVSGALTVEGGWYQTPPKDLSQEAIKWYTWGFEGRSVFVAKVSAGDGDRAEIVIDGQACNESRCRMVDRVKIELQADAAGSDKPDLSSLVEVKLESGEEP